MSKTQPDPKAEDLKSEDPNPPTTDETPLDGSSVAHHFILREGDEKPTPIVRELSPEEEERRDLQRRFKKLRGFKPTTKDLDEMRHLVAQAERAAGYYGTV